MERKRGTPFREEIKPFGRVTEMVALKDVPKEFWLPSLGRSPRIHHYDNIMVLHVEEEGRSKRILDEIGGAGAEINVKC